MKSLIITGVLLMVLGVAALVYGGITYTQNEEVLDIGPLEAEVEQENTVPLPPALGIVALVLGAGLTIYGVKKS